MLNRLCYTLKARPYYAFLFFLLVGSLFYLYLNYIQERQTTGMGPGELCMSELTSVKYQLNAVTEYKNRIDKVLTETLQSYSAEVSKYIDIMEHCLAMKHQSFICQSQFEDLQRECKKVREDYDKLKQLKNAR